MAGTPLEFLLELDAKVDGALKMIRVLTETETVLGKAEHAINKTEATSRKAVGGHEKHATVVKRLEHAIEHMVHAGLEPMLERFKAIAEFHFIRRAVDAILEAPERLIEKVIELGNEILHVAAKTEALEKSFKFALGAEAGEEALEWADKLSKVTQYTDDEIKGMVLSLSKAGLEGQRLEDAIRGALDIAALSPDRLGGMQEAVASLSKMARTGVIDNRALAGLGIGAKDFAKLDRFKGKSRKDIAKLMEEGKVTENEVYKLITMKTGQALGGAGAAMGDTLQASLLHVKDLPEQYMEKFSRSPALDLVRNKIGEVLTALDPDSPRGARIFASLERSILMIVDVFSRIDVEKAALTIETKLVPAFESMTHAIGPFVDVLSKVVDVIQTIFQVVKASNPVMLAKEAIDLIRHPIDAGNKVLAGEGAMGAMFGLTQKFNTATATALGAVGKEIAGVGQSSKGDVSAYLGVGKNVAMGVAAGIKSGTSVTTAATKDMGAATVSALQKSWQIRSPSRVFENIGAQAAAGLAMGLEGGRGPVERATAEIVDIPRASSGAGASARSVTVEVGGIHITVHLGPEASKASGDEIADRIAELVPAKLAAALEKIALEMGTGGGQ